MTAPGGSDLPTPVAVDGTGAGQTLLSRGSAAGRITLITVTLGTAISLLDGTVVNIAVKAIGTDLKASLGALQWVVNG